MRVPGKPQAASTCSAGLQSPLGAFLQKENKRDRWSGSNPWLLLPELGGSSVPMELEVLAAALGAPRGEVVTFEGASAGPLERQGMA